MSGFTLVRSEVGRKEKQDVQNCCRLIARRSMTRLNINISQNVFNMVTSRETDTSDMLLGCLILTAVEEITY